MIKCISNPIIRTDICDHRGFFMPLDRGKLYQYVTSHFDAQHQVEVTFEIGCCGFWAARELLNYGWKVMVVNPGDIKRSDKHRYQKTNAIDSRHICQQLQKQELSPSLYQPNRRNNSAAYCGRVTILQKCFANKNHK
ncbi:hypothetical protein BH11BAC5_BH11BAC5_23820 [soil metagenome]